MGVKRFLAAWVLFFSTVADAQTQPLAVQSNIVMPADTVTANRLMRSINGFLSHKEKANSENPFVLREDLLETSLLLDELKGIEKSGKFKDEHFYKGYLTNVVPLDAGHFLLQFSYIGVNEKEPLLMGNFEILAKPSGDRFYFYSPLKRHTTAWKTKRIGSVVFHFKNTLNEKTASSYAKTVAAFDAKLNAKNKTTVWYGCNDMSELLQNIGVSYKMIYNSKAGSTFSARENDTLLIVDGSGNSTFETFDPHDLWHERLGNVLAKSTTNKPVDEGCAYLYGGSWGISWPQILKMFRQKVASSPNVDWLTAYDDFTNFGDSKEQYLLTPYVINALLVQKIENERGFAAVLQLLGCGKYEKGNENYFATLEKVSGITKANFNGTIWKLLNEGSK